MLQNSYKQSGKSWKVACGGCHSVTVDKGQRLGLRHPVWAPACPGCSTDPAPAVACEKQPQITQVSGLFDPCDRHTIIYSNTEPQSIKE